MRGMSRHQRERQLLEALFPERGGVTAEERDRIFGEFFGPITPDPNIVAVRRLLRMIRQDIARLR